jgi:hypothetical protein
MNAVLFRNVPIIYSPNKVLRACPTTAEKCPTMADEDLQKTT